MLNKSPPVRSDIRRGLSSWRNLLNVGLDCVRRRHRRSGRAEHQNAGRSWRQPRKLIRPCRQAVDLTTQLSKYANLPIPYSSCRYAVIGRPDFPLAFGISTAMWPEIIWGDDRVQPCAEKARQ